MTESQFLNETSAEFEKAAAEIDGLLAHATESTWQATRPDNGWTTAQIVEHLWRTTEFYKERVEGALAAAPAGAADSTLQLGFMARMILKDLARRKTPAPGKLVVKEVVSSQTAAAHWEEVKAQTRRELKLAGDHSIKSAKFWNPFIPIMRMSAADYFALQVEHLRYHAPQIAARVGA